MNRPIEIRTLTIDELVPADYNPRRKLRPTDPEYRKLKRSVEAFGLVEPLVWNERTGRLVGGHQRLSILQELGQTHIPVSVVQLSEAEEKALNVLLNNPEAQSRYDVPKLIEVLEELKDLPQFADTGFDPHVLDLLVFQPEPLPPLLDSNRVEVTLITDTETFERIRDRVDVLTREFDLETHVRRG
jgi:ParB-like chromosome segregation protein Spo0J